MTTLTIWWRVSGQDITRAKLPGLKVGDKISFTAFYYKTAENFALNILDEAGNALLHIAFRQNEGAIVMNSRVIDRWQKELRAPFPNLKNGKMFNVTISCLTDQYVACFNGERMPKVEFPYRHRPSTAAEVNFWGSPDVGLPILLISITTPTGNC